MSPIRRWKTAEILLEGEEGSFSIALGTWDKQPCLAMRWNGNEEQRIGNPQSRGLPTWFVIPNEFRDVILDVLRKQDIDSSKIAYAHSFLSEQ